MFRALTYQLLSLWHALLRGPRALLKIVVAPVKWIGLLFVHTVEWWSRRESKFLVRGIPSIVVFSVAAYLLVACRLRSDAALTDRYLLAAKRSNDPEASALLYERVVSLRPDDDAALFEFAMRSSAAGDKRRAQVILLQLAPLEGQEYAPAQLVMGRQDLALQHLSRQFRSRPKRHLTNAVTLAPRNPECHAWLGMFYFGWGVWDPAIYHFEAAFDPRNHNGGELADGVQPFRLSLAKAYAFDGQLDRAEDEAQLALDYFARRVKNNPTDDMEARRYLAEAWMFLEKFEDAAVVLETGVALKPDDVLMRNALARFYVAWSDAMLNTGQGTRERRFELLSDALRLDPNYAPIFQGMMGILTEGDTTADAAREFLLANVATGESIGLSHLLLGSAAFQTNDSESAAFHLERAFELLDAAPIVANNLAWFLAFNDEPPDLERALSLIDRVLVDRPDDPRFLDTRGQVYPKLGRCEDAIRDLARALDQPQPAPETHAALAECYAAKGLDDLAGQHRQLAAPNINEQ